MKSGRIFGLIFISFSLLSCKEQGAPDYVEIPFKLEDNRVIIDATANGKKGRFIFDTGSTESYADINTINLLPRAFTKTKYKGRMKTVLVYNLNRITFGDVVLKTRSWVIKRSDSLVKRKKEGYDGVLGSRVFEGFWCELSFSKNKIILHKEKPEYFTNFSPVKILTKYDADFYIPSVIDGKTFYLNIDTGMPWGISFPNGLIKIKKPGEYWEIVSDEEIGTYHLVKTDSINILDKTYTGLFVMTNSIIAARRNDNDAYNDLGMLGIDFLKYYDFLFDYRELRDGKSTGLYYEPNTSLKNRNYGFFSFIKEVPELGVLNFSIDESKIVIHSIIKDSIAYELCNFRPGTIITKINGIPVAKISPEEITDFSFYLTVDNYTILENNIERTILSPLKGDLYEISAPNRRN
jgi:hypothetical protein